MSQGETSLPTGKLSQSRLQDLDSHMRQEGLNKVKKGFTMLISVVQKVELPASSAAPQSKPEPSPRKKDWHKRTKKECIATCDAEKAMSIARAYREYAIKSPVMRSLFSEIQGGTTQPVQRT